MGNFPPSFGDALSDNALMTVISVRKHRKKIYFPFSTRLKYRNFIARGTLKSLKLYISRTKVMQVERTPRAHSKENKSTVEPPVGLRQASASVKHPRATTDVEQVPRTLLP